MKLSQDLSVSFTELDLFLANLFWNFFTSDSSFDLLIFNVDFSDSKFLIVSRAFSICLLKSCFTLIQFWLKMVLNLNIKMQVVKKIPL